MFCVCRSPLRWLTFSSATKPRKIQPIPVTTLRANQHILNVKSRPLRCSFVSYKLKNSMQSKTAVLSSENFRTIRTSSPLYVNPLYLIILRPVSKLLAIIIGRGIRVWYKKLSEKEKTKFWKKVDKNAINITMGVVIAISFYWLYYVSHLEYAPLTARSRFMLFTPDQFNSISKKMFDINMDFYRDKMLPKSHPVHQYVTKVIQRLLLGNDDLNQIHDRQWTINIINSNEYNAYVLPTGDIFVFGGMLELASNEDQLGCILGHEMAHAILGHAAELLSYLHFLDLFMMLVIITIWALVPTDWYSIFAHIVANRLCALMFELPYNRMLESEADQVGLELAAKSCFDIRESSVFWKKMSVNAPRKTELFEWLSTHPNHAKRAGTLDQLIPQALETREMSNCPALSAVDPRKKRDS